MTRSELILSITDLKVRINDLEVQTRYRQDQQSMQSLRDSLHEARTQLNGLQLQLRDTDESWIFNKRLYIEALEKKAATADVGGKARIADEIAEYKQRIQQRIESMNAHG